MMMTDTVMEDCRTASTALGRGMHSCDVLEMTDH